MAKISWGDIYRKLPKMSFENIGKGAKVAAEAATLEGKIGARGGHVSVLQRIGGRRGKLLKGLVHGVGVAGGAAITGALKVDWKKQGPKVSLGIIGKNVTRALRKEFVPRRPRVTRRHIKPLEGEHFQLPGTGGHYHMPEDEPLSHWEQQLAAHEAVQQRFKKYHPFAYQARRVAGGLAKLSVPIAATALAGSKASRHLSATVGPVGVDVGDKLTTVSDQYGWGGRTDFGAGVKYKGAPVFDTRAGVGFGQARGVGVAYTYGAKANVHIPNKRLPVSIGGEWSDEAPFSKRRRTKRVEHIQRAVMTPHARI